MANSAFRNNLTPDATFTTPGKVLQTVYNVMEAPYNAVGDGVADDSDAIQAALDACEAAGGGIVTGPALTYKITAQSAYYSYLGGAALLVGSNTDFYMPGSTFTTGAIPGGAGAEGYMTMIGNKNPTTGGNTNIRVRGMRLTNPAPLENGTGMLRYNAAVEFHGVARSEVVDVVTDYGGVIFYPLVSKESTATTLDDGNNFNNRIAQLRAYNQTGSTAFFQGVDCVMENVWFDHVWDDPILIGSAGRGHKLRDIVINYTPVVAGKGGSNGGIYLGNDGAVSSDVDGMDNISMSNITVYGGDGFNSGLQGGIGFAGSNRNIKIDNLNSSLNRRGLTFIQGALNIQGMQISNSHIYSNTLSGLDLELVGAADGTADVSLINNDVYNNGGAGLTVYADGVGAAVATITIRSSHNRYYDNQGSPTQTYSISTNTDTDGVINLHSIDDYTPQTIHSSGAGLSSSSSIINVSSGLLALPALSNNLRVPTGISSTTTGNVLSLTPASSSYIALRNPAGTNMATLGAGEGSAVAAYKQTGTTYLLSAYTSTDSSTLAFRVDGSGDVSGVGAITAGGTLFALNKIASTQTGSSFAITPASTSYVKITNPSGQTLATFNAGDNGGVSAYNPGGGGNPIYLFKGYSTSDSTTTVFSVNTSGAVVGASFAGSGAGLTGIPESGVTNLVSDLALKAPLASPTFTGTVTAAALSITGAASVGGTLSVLNKVLGTQATSVLEIQPGASSYIKLSNQDGNMTATVHAGEGSALALYMPSGVTYSQSWYTSTDSSALAMRVDGSGHLTHADGKNVILGTSTGTKIGTATSQKLALWNATPVVQPGATTDLGVVLSDIGARAAGTAYPITTSGAVTLTGTVTLTTPIISQINDASGNEELTLTSVASAVNFVNISNTATTAGPIIQSTGDDTNVDLFIKTKASGQIRVRPGTNSVAAFRVETATGGATILAVDTSNTRVGVGNSAPTSVLHVTGPVATAITNKVTTATIAATESTITGDTTSAGFTLTLPTAVGCTGRQYTIKKTVAANTLTIGTTSSQTIDGSTTQALTTQYSAYTVQSDNANWHIIGKV